MGPGIGGIGNPLLSILASVWLRALYSFNDALTMPDHQQPHKTRNCDGYVACRSQCRLLSHNGIVAASPCNCQLSFYNTIVMQFGPCSATVVRRCDCQSMIRVNDRLATVPRT
jgi:hypothetical protein